MEPTLMVVGVNHRTAPVALRERFWIPEERRYEALVQLSRAEGIEEVVVLATCNRTEFLLWAADVTLAANSVMRLLATEYGLKLCEWKHFYRLLDEAALLHICRVASGLDSAENGEPRIVSEVEEAWKQAQKMGSTGRCLDAVLKKALSISERVRNEVAIGNPAASIRDTERLLQVEAQDFCRTLRGQRVVPTIIALRQRLDEICRQELDSFKQENGPFTQDQVEMLTAVMSRMTQRITGSLARELKELPEKVQQEQMTTAVQRLFHLQTHEAALAGTSFYGE